MLARTSRKAAGVPISMASRPVPTPTINERVIACIHTGEAGAGIERQRDHQERGGAQKGQYAQHDPPQGARLAGARHRAAQPLGQ
ncbi:hypothetical protein G6F68_021090 [Rhizopus microsporus]|nr:hypothetical protein G6F68_021090 [Rhizopus microsporus]